ncbi:MAG: YceI family protein [Anaeromyxobacter sp.]|nr:YceI family protein [Anaeromyxobacter sp.]MBL0276729.1 YceI family protein [Anaeromyxobacter sp.]
MKLFTAALAALLALPVLAADTFKIDGAHSQASFSVKHLLISNVRGEFGKTEGVVVFDEADPAKSRVEATIDVASVNTRDEKRDAHLKNADFFEVAKFPTITFKSTKVEKATGGLKVTGDLTMKGVTKQVVLDVTGPTAEVKDPWGNAKRGVSATTQINRKDFGVSYGPDAIVSDLVKIQIDAELTKDQPKK